jgi:hypothetical protein
VIFLVVKPPTAPLTLGAIGAHDLNVAKPGRHGRPWRRQPQLVQSALNTRSGGITPR